jgi:predicted DNA binding CopG/RHH family protein
MSKKTSDVIYEEGTLGRLQAIKDFLPPPEELVKKEEKVKITLELSKQSVDYFKKAAKSQGVAYQAMIRSLVDRYVASQ